MNNSRRRQPGLCIGLVLIASLAGCGRPQTDAVEARVAIPDSSRLAIRSFWRHFREATRLRLAGDFVAAADAYAIALEANPTHGDALYYAGNVALELGQWRKSETILRRLVAADPSSARGYAQLGHLYMCRPEIPTFDIKKAKEAFEAAHTLNKEETGPVLRLGEVHLLEGDYERAETYLDAVLGANDTSVEARLTKAYIAWEGGNGVAAVAEMNQALSRIAQKPSAPVAGEGDTKDGARPALAGGASCPLFESFADSVDTADPPVAHERMERLFRTMQRTLDQIG